ncbi:MAG: thioredoxin domain-containing protein, partial [Candidatus Micrarchaeota archaeon]|nr:thioredoxin domain-containing protein [Candidatus Micrarchaeota archaeon]
MASSKFVYAFLFLTFVVSMGCTQFRPDPALGPRSLNDGFDQVALPSFQATATAYPSATPLPDVSQAQAAVKAASRAAADALPFLSEQFKASAQTLSTQSSLSGRVTAGDDFVLPNGYRLHLRSISSNPDNPDELLAVVDVYDDQGNLVDSVLLRAGAEFDEFGLHLRVSGDFAAGYADFFITLYPLGSPPSASPTPVPGGLGRLVLDVSSANGSTDLQGYLGIVRIEANGSANGVESINPLSGGLTSISLDSGRYGILVTAYDHFPGTVQSFDVHDGDVLNRTLLLQAQNISFTAQNVSRETRTDGMPDAPVTLVAYDDYQSPFLKSFREDTWPQVYDDYIHPGQVKYAYRFFPLAFHPSSRAAVQAALCAQEQGRFGFMLDAYAHLQAGMNRPYYFNLFGGMNGYAREFDACFGQGRYADQVDADIAAARQAGVTGVPTFILSNGRSIVGAQPYPVFKEELDRALSGENPSPTPGSDGTLYVEVSADDASVLSRVYVGVQVPGANNLVMNVRRLENVANGTASFALPPGTYHAVVSGYGRLPDSRLVNVSAGQTAQVAFSLAPAQAASILDVNASGRIRGNASAAVVMTAYEDLLSPYVRQFHRNTYPFIYDAYVANGTVAYQYRAFPLSYNPAGRTVAEALLCAQEQRDFWYFHGTLSYVDADLSRTDMLSHLAGSVGLDVRRFDACIAARTYASQVDADLAKATDAGVTGVPTFDVNGQRIVGAQSFATFSRVIDRAIAEALNPDATPEPTVSVCTREYD